MVLSNFNKKEATKNKDYIARYYATQSSLRGVTEIDDVKSLLASNSSFYDRLILPILKDNSDKKVVELACGPGIFMRYLRSRGFENIVGIEFADSYIELCKAQNLNVVQADVFHWLKKQPAASVDAFIAIHFIEHLDKQALVELLDLVSFCLVPGGIFIARAPSGDSPFFGQNFFNDITHETVLTTTATKALLKMCDLDLLKVVDEFPVRIAARKLWLYPLVISLRFVVEKLVLLSTGYTVKNLSPNFWLFAMK